MLIYCNELILSPDGGIATVLAAVSTWLSRKYKIPVNCQALRDGSSLQLPDGAILEAVTNQPSVTLVNYPLLLCLRLTHGESNFRGERVSGRQWLTEIGIEQLSEGENVRCTILVEVSDISTRVTTIPQVSRPGVLLNLIESCNPDRSVAGITMHALTVGDASLLLDHIKDGDRPAPIVIVSPTRGGDYLIKFQRLHSMLYGLAELFIIPSTENTFAIAESLGELYAPYLGAIKIIFPMRHNARTPFIEVKTLLPSDLLGNSIDSAGPDEEVLSLITHRTNLPYSWRHISFTKVASSKLKKQISEKMAIAQALSESSQASGADSEMAQLLQLAFSDIASRDQEVKNLQSKILDAESEATQLQAEAEEAELQHQAQIKSLIYSLEQKDKSIGKSQPIAIAKPFKNAIFQIARGDASPEQLMVFAEQVFQDELIILDSAIASANRSSDFMHKRKLFDLITKLATEYRQILIVGGGDNEARRVFGANVYAPKESDTLSNFGRAQRTFVYNETATLMEKHLKIGTADNAADTIRVHFYWDPKDCKIVIGYCGPHLAL